MVKAGILEKIVRFCEWPPEMNMDTFKIKVVGHSPFDGALEKVFATVKVKDKPVSIEYTSSMLNVDNCHVLFISYSENSHLGSIIDKVSSKPILTIGETKGYIDKGVIINLFETSRRTIHFKISKKIARESKVKLDLKLLGYAKLVE